MIVANVRFDIRAYSAPCVFALGLLKLVKDSDGDAGTGGAERMAEGDDASVEAHVVGFVGKAKAQHGRPLGGTPTVAIATVRARGVSL